MKNYYTLVIANNEVGIYNKNIGEASWINTLINGEELNRVKSKEDLNKLIQHLNNNLNLSDNLKSCAFVVLYEKSSIHLLNDISKILSQLECLDWQILCLEMIIQRASSTKVMPALINGNYDQQWVKTIVMPTLETVLDYQGDALVAELTRVRAKHEETKEDLRRDRQKLEQELEQLRKQIKAIQKVDVESLLIYLPIIYKNFWTDIQPSDLALLAGTYAIPEIPNPFPEPDKNTIASMKKRLQNLPESELRKLKDFCQEITHRLNIRPEMKFMLED